MRTELVNTLIKAGVVTEPQVERASLYNFGTSLVERLLCLGYGSEDDVFKIIKNNLKLKVVEADELENIQEDILNEVPHYLIEKHHFLPFYSDHTKLHVAFFDPTKDSCFTEVAFFTSKVIVPFGARASVLSKALNKYFNFKLPEEFRYGKEQIVDPKLTPPPLMDGGPTVPKPTMPPIPTSRPKPPLPNLEPIEEPSESIIEAAVDKNSAINAVNIELKKLSNGRSTILFVKYDDLVTVDGSDLKVSLQVPSFFKDVYDSKKRFYGMPPKSPVSDEFFDRTGGSVPSLICIVPVSIEDEVFALLYAEGVENPMEVEDIAERMAIVFDRLLSN